MGKVTCEACKKKCKKEAVRLQDKYYHVSCFACKECQKPLAMDGFYTKDGAHYCADDYHRLFVGRCRVCGELADGNVVSVLGDTYHQQCFHCSKCGRKFEPGDKVTFSTKEHWCKACTAEADHIESPSSPGAKKLGSPLTVSPPKPPRAHDMTDSEGLGLTPSTDKSGYGSSNGLSPEVAKMASLTASTYNDSELSSSHSPDASTMKSSVKPSNQPARFGTPDNRFYNMSYLACTAPADYKRKSTNIPVPKDPEPRHFHRPDNFSYTSVKKDFVKPVRHEPGDKQETGGQKAIERDDWPGPPEPAVAYPELFREKVFVRKSESDAVDDKNVSSAKSPAEEQQITKEMTELSKMTESGTAAIVLRDLRKKRSESPTLDPRNASRTPSAAIEPSNKPRYRTPYFASPSRDLEMLRRHRSRSADNRPRTAPPTHNELMAPRPGYGLKCITPDILTGRALMDGVDGDPLARRPQSSAAYVHLRTSSPGSRTPTDEFEYDPTTGLRHSSYLRSLTLPPGVSSHYVFDNVPLTAGSLRLEEPPKVYAYEELKSEACKQLPDVDQLSLERHLSREEFEALFKMTRAEFYRLPAWKQNDEKMRLGLWTSDEKARASVGGVV